MESQVITQPVTVKSLSGDVVIVNAQGQARPANVGDVLQPGEMIITGSNAEVLLETAKGPVTVDPNCIGCLPVPVEVGGAPDLLIAPVKGDVEIDPTALNAANFDAQDIAAIQEAIAAGVDPTAVLEASAAGAGSAGSANGGAITIAYNYLETLASTLFDTNGFTQSFPTPEIFNEARRFIAGAQDVNISTQVSEGSLSLGTYPQVTSVTTLIGAGSLPLLPASFVPEPTFLSNLLAELNRDITSSGQPVVFRYDAASNSIIGERDGSPVLTIAISAQSIGRDVSLTITTTLLQPIDHLPSVGGGLVSINGDQISIAMQLTGTDSNGNPIQSPIDVNLQINDGSPPVLVNPLSIATLSENDLPEGSDRGDPLTTSGRFDAQLGSDNIAFYQIGSASGSAITGLTSQGEPVILGEATIVNGNRVYQATAGGRDIFQLTLNADGTYQFVLQGTLDHAAGSDLLTISLPIVAVDYDNDRSAPINFNIQIQDDKPSIIQVEPLTVNEGALASSGDVEGEFTTTEGSDGVVSYRLSNLTDAVAGITSGGVQLVLTESIDSNGNYTYTAAANNSSIFTLKLNADGSYRFTLLGPVDHDISRNDETLTLGFTVVATDFDGDTSSIVLPVTVIDDKPQFLNPNNVDDLLLNEDDLLNGSDGSKEPLTANGQAPLQGGLDRVTKFELDSSVNPVQGLTSNGVALVLSAPVADGNGNLIYTATAGGNPIFTFSMNPNGSYSFTLTGPLDHAANSDELKINFKALATDADGDKASIVLPVKIIDDKPTITNVQALSLAEDDLAQGSDTSKESLSASGQFTVVQGADRVVSYQLDSSVNPVQGLTSNGVAVTLSAPVNDGNGNLTYTASAGSHSVFSLVLKADGTYTFTLLGPVDHALNSDELLLNFKVIATDVDGDTTSIVLPVKINDDKPSLSSAEGLYVHENDLPQGSDTSKEPVAVSGQFQLVQGADTVKSFVLDSSVNPVQGITSNGVAVTLSAPVNDGNGNLTYTASAGSHSVFSLVLKADGTYTFTLLGRVDHALNSDELTLNFNVIATDVDGDTASIVLPVKIIDDKPTLTGVQALTVDEDDLAQGSDISKEPVAVSGQFQLVQGADTVKSFTLDSSVNPVQGITSNGVAVTLSAPVNDGNGNLTYTASAGSHSVFSLVLKADGSYTFTLLGPVDHALNSDDLTLNFKVIATDVDGDATSIVLPVKINDDKPYFTQVVGLYVHEDDLLQGSDTSKEPVTVNGQFQLVQGADTVNSFVLDSSVNPVQGLTSNGVAVTLSAPVNDGNGNLTYTATAGGNTVFSLMLNANGTYSFTLSAPVDHALNSNDLTLNFKVIGTDVDGDRHSVILPVKINDDDLYFTNVEGLDVHEDDLPQGSDTSKEPVTVNGQFQLVQGADTVKSFVLDSSVNPVQGITSNGVAVTLSAPVNDGNGNLTYTATTGSTTVFSLVLKTDGTYTFTLSAPVDHALNTNDLTLNFKVIATDVDGDTASIVLPVKINDDKPYFTKVDGLYLHENDLPQGSDSSKEPLIGSGQFQLEQGADTVKSFALDSSVNPVQGLTSNGVAVTLSAPVNDGNGNLTYTATAGSTTVFSLVLKADGTYTFTLSAPVDHALNTNDLTLNFQVIATDVDGDTASIVLPVKINDDSPYVSTVQHLFVHENDLPQGSDNTKESLTASGQFEIKGADSVTSIALDGSVDQLQGLTSNGVAVTLSAPVNDGQGNLTYTASAGSNTVFSLVLKLDGSYTFTLLGPVDHASNSNDLTLNFAVLVTDVDGDSDTTDLQVKINDDKPTITGVQALAVDEDDLVQGSDTTKETLTASGQFTTTQGADKVVSYTLDLTTNPLTGLTSGGQALTLSSSVDANGNNSYTARISGGSEIFTLQLNKDGNYSFTLKGALDHIANSDERLLNFTVVATDADGDKSSIILPVTVVDDQPMVLSAQALSVSEDDLAIGSDQPKDAVTASGQFTTTQGADGIAHYRIDTSAGSNTGLTSQGQPVVWGAPAINGQIYTYQGIANGVVIFTLVLRADGSYSFTINGAVDHAVNTDQLTLNIPVLAQDKDGDTSPITLPVTIVDDVPTLHDKNIVLQEGANAQSVNLFSRDNNLSPDTQGADRGVITQFSAVDEAGRDIQFRDGTELTNDVELNGATKTVTVVEIISGVSRDLGTLVIQPNGTATFTPVSLLNHSNDEAIDFTVNVTAKDGDQDTSTEQLNITISDRTATITQQKFTGYEDQGHDASLNLVPVSEQSNLQDNLGGLPIEALKLALQVNLHDIDQGETLGQVSIWNPNDIAGDFYYRDSSNQLVKLNIEPSSGHIVLSAALLQQSVNGSVATVENLYFVPDRHYSTTGGGMNASVGVEILHNGVRDHFTNGNMRIEIESVAEIATWTSSSEFHYNATEDSSNITLNIAAQTQDNSVPETITYQIRFTENGTQAKLVYSDGTPITAMSDANGTYYQVPANKIAQVQVDPNNHFSGQIKLSVTAITQESTNFVTGKQTAQSETKQIVIDVAPDADRGSFSVNRISIFEDNASHKDAKDPTTEHDPLLLSEVISMSGSLDVDGSESLFVRLSEFTDTGATLVWLGTGASPIAVNTYPNGKTYYEIPRNVLSQVEVLPSKHSNQDFTFKVEGVVKDNATLSTGQAQDIESLGFKTVNVTMKGVADLPVFGVVSGNVTWTPFANSTEQGVQALVKENSVVDLNFSILSGEIADKPNDSSETISVLLSNIPDGVKLFDSDGVSLDLVFAGYDSNNRPMYQANLTMAQVLTGIQVQPITSSTQNIDITATVVVTENDGHVRQVDEIIRIIVEPKIDAVENYQNTVTGNEDSRINVAWVPQNTDSHEYASRVEISGFPANSLIFVNNTQVTLVDGKLVLIPAVGESDVAFFNRVSAAGYIQVQPPLNSSTDFTLTTKVMVHEQDHEYVNATNPGQGIVQKEIQGSIAIKVNPIVEADGQLQVEKGGNVAQTVQSDASGNIDFTINSANGNTNINVIRFDNLDSKTSGSYQSAELVDQLVVSFGNVSPAVLDKLLITGAINNGDGTWTITNEANFSIKAPNGLPFNNGKITVTITATVYDQGENTNEAKITREVSSELTLSFPTSVTGNNSVAAELNWVGAADDLVIGKEDNSVNLGAQIQTKFMVTASGFDTVVDELSIVINASDLPAGASIVGQDFNFVDGQYVFKGTLNADGSISGLEGLMLIPPRDFAGDFVLPITFVTTDTQSGDEKTMTAPVPVAITPVVDVPDSSADQPLDNNLSPTISLNVTETLGLDANRQPTDLANDTPIQGGTAYEDGIVHLNLAIGLADSLNDTTQGKEVLTEVTLTLNNSSVGTFVNASGQVLGTSITLSQASLPAALSEIYFKSASNYPTVNNLNTVGITVTGKVTDSTVFDNTNANSQGVSSSDSGKTFTSQVSFKVTPVVDNITIGSGGPISVTGDEDDWINLTNSQGSALNINLTDLDGSEQFVSIVLTGLPTDFLVKSSSNDYVVKNSGGGEWTVQIKNTSLTTLDLSSLEIKPTRDFSGRVDLGIKVFTKEALLALPFEHATKVITLNITPVADDLDIAPVTQAMGNEGELIDIMVGAMILDKAASLPANGANYLENGLETIRVEISGVPNGASIGLPNGTQGVNLGNGVWKIDINAQQLDKLVFNSGDNNERNWNGNLHFKVQSVDTDLAGTAHLGSAQEFDVHVEVAAVNDKPVIDGTQLPSVIDESAGQKLSGIMVSDVDYVGVDANQLMTVTLSVTEGVLSIQKPATSLVVVSNGPNGQVVLEGSPTEINALLNHSTATYGLFVNATAISGTQINLTVVANDRGVFSDNPSSPALQESKTYSIQVTPIANTPNLSINPALDYGQQVYANQSVSAQGIPILGAIAALTDVHEVLSLRLDNLPAGASLASSTGTVTNLGNGEWKISADALPNVKVVGLTEGTHTLTLTAVSTETNGSSAESTNSIDYQIKIAANSDMLNVSSATADSMLIADQTGMRLISGSGNDYLRGGTGNDELVGGKGNDELLGGLGADSFEWTVAGVDNGVDRVRDFSVNQGDSIDLTDVLEDLRNHLSMDDILDNLTSSNQLSAQVVQNDLRLSVITDNNVNQTIVIDNLATQINFTGMNSHDILGTLLEQNVLRHD